jgi:hypothetical protein
MSTLSGKEHSSPGASRMSEYQAFEKPLRYRYLSLPHPHPQDDPLFRQLLLIGLDPVFSVFYLRGSVGAMWDWAFFEEAVVYPRVSPHFQPPVSVVMHGRIPPPRQQQPQMQLVVSDPCSGVVLENPRLRELVILLVSTAAPWGVRSWSSQREVAGDQLQAVPHPSPSSEFQFQFLLSLLAFLASSCHYSSVFGSPVRCPLSEHHQCQSQSAKGSAYSLAFTLP